MLFNSEVVEKNKDDRKCVVKLSYIDIVPEKASFWSGDQSVQVIREAAPISSLPGNNADAFVQQVSQALQNLMFKIGFKGMPVSLEQQEQLWKNWLLLRDRLAETYTGDWVTDTLTKIDHKMRPSDQLMPIVMQDLFLNDYFRNIYDLSFDNGLAQVHRNVYGLTPEPARFNETWKLTSSAEHHVVKFSGKADGNNISQSLRTWIKNKSGHEPANTRIIGRGFFEVNKETGWCSSFESTYSLSTESGFEKIVRITLTSI